MRPISISRLEPYEYLLQITQSSTFQHQFVSQFLNDLAHIQFIDLLSRIVWVKGRNALHCVTNGMIVLIDVLADKHEIFIGMQECKSSIVCAIGHQHLCCLLRLFTHQ